MANQDFESVFLFFADLAKSEELGLTSVTSPGTFMSRSRFSPFSTFQHWAIQIRETCYEVTAFHDAALGKKSYKMNVTTIKDWTERRDANGLKFKKIKIGITRLSDKEILAEANLIWTVPFEETYKLTRQNCQNFAYLLSQRVCVDEKDRQISKEERRTWQRMPNHLSQYKTVAKRASPLAVTALLIDSAHGMVLSSAVGTTALGVLSLHPVVGGVVVIGAATALVAPFVVGMSEEHKWLKDMKKAEKEIEAVSTMK